MKSRHFSRFAGIALVTVMAFALCSLIAVVSGTFVPLQTSTLSEFGVCLQDEVYDPVNAVPTDVVTLYICGILDGETKRSVAFEVFYSDKPIYYTERSWPPVEFFSPIHASQLRYVDVDKFPQGEYRIDAVYSREPFASVFFKVETP